MQLRERLAYAVGTSAPGATSVESLITKTTKGRALQSERAREVVLPRGVRSGVGRLGEVYYREDCFPLDHRQGRIALEDALRLDDALLERLGPDLGPAHVRDAAYLDIETTGLSGGTGTYAFLVGIGTFEGYAFRVRQYFLPEPSAEPAMLAAIAETVERCSALVTFNGRTFDMPMLATRYALSRQPPLAEDLPHIDLLHPSRRMFARRLESCRLAEIERSLLGVRRMEDIASWLIPDLYFAYIRRAAVEGLHPVFEHNQLDVLSMPALLAYLNRVAGDRVPRSAGACLALGRWDEARGRLPDAVRLYEAAWRADVEGDDGAEAVRRLARLVRREGRWQDCEAIWESELRTAAGAPRLTRALIETAKLQEHRHRDYAGALASANRALAIVTRSPHVYGWAPIRHALQHRIARLERRVARKVVGAQ